MKIRLAGAELFHTDVRTDRRTDMTKLIAHFRNFANAPKNVTESITTVLIIWTEYNFFQVEPSLQPCPQ
jgi:Fe-S-cluster formation regulator IscX/YfhJ